MSTHRGTIVLPETRTFMAYGWNGSDAFYDTGGWKFKVQEFVPSEKIAWLCIEAAKGLQEEYGMDHEEWIGSGCIGRSHPNKAGSPSIWCTRD